MKSSLVITFLVLGSVLYGQTDSIEKAVLYNRFTAKEIRQDEYAKTLTSWANTIKVMGAYPDIPLDQNGKAHYIYLYDFKGLGKDYLFNRILEWLSINYGLIPAYLYSNLQDGKIIFRNSINLHTGNSCTYSSVISLKDDKILMEIINIRYQTIIEGHYSNNEWVPESTFEFPVSEVYPVILKKPSGWGTSLNLLRATNDFFNTEKQNLFDYIITYYPF